MAAAIPPPAQSRLGALQPEPQLLPFLATASKWTDPRWAMGDLRESLLAWQQLPAGKQRALLSYFTLQPQTTTSAEQSVKHFQKIGELFIANYRNASCGSLLVWEERDARPFVLPEPDSMGGCDVGSPTGLEDPRSIMWRGRPWAVVHETSRHNSVKPMVLIDLRLRKKVRLWLRGEHRQFRNAMYWLRKACSLRGNPPIGRCVEKNWAPFVWRGRLRFVYSMSPLSVVELHNESTGECRVVAGDLQYVRNNTGVTVSGGSPLVPLDGPAGGATAGRLVGLAHAITETPQPDPSIAYRVAFVVLDPARNELAVGPAVDFPVPAHPLAQPPAEWLRQHKSVQYPYELDVAVGGGGGGPSVRVGVEMNDRFPTWFSFDAELLRGLLPGPDAQVVVAGPLSPKWANSPVRPW